MRERERESRWQPCVGVCAELAIAEKKELRKKLTKETVRNAEGSTYTITYYTLTYHALTYCTITCYNI